MGSRTWLRLLAVAALPLLAPPARAQGKKTCDAYNCDASPKCEWRISRSQFDAGHTLEGDRRATNAYATMRGHCSAAKTPFSLQGYAISGDARLTLNRASPRAVVQQWEVHHVRTCKACAHTEGRGRAEAIVSFVGHAAIRDPFLADARAEVEGYLSAREATTGCRAAVKGGLTVSSAGAVGVSATVGALPGGGGSSSKNFGNARELTELFHALDAPRDVEMNHYYVTLEASINRAMLAVDGGPFWIAQALIGATPTAYQLKLHLSCDNCLEPRSRLTAIFPQ